MSIVVIKGDPKTGKSLYANALRNDQIARGMGALLIDEHTEGELPVLVEKILAGVAMPKEPPKDLSELPWKKSPMVILVGDAGVKRLDQIEAAMPGFTAFMGPVYTIEAGKA